MRNTKESGWIKQAALAAIVVGLAQTGAQAQFRAMSGWGERAETAQKQEKPPVTYLKAWKSPSPDQYRVAADILTEARQALIAGDKNLYNRKMKKLEYFSVGRKVNKRFEGQIMCGEYVAFTEEAHEECGEAIVFETACYKGGVEQAETIVKTALQNQEWNWDEEWADNPRADGDALLIDIVDGPNSETNTFRIPACR